jgi:hypothetical protein
MKGAAARDFSTFTTIANIRRETQHRLNSIAQNYLSH